jgi:hypothetical protein
MDYIEYDIIKKDVTKNGTIYLTSDSILIFAPHQNLKKITIQDMEMDLEIFLKFSKGQKIPFFYNAEYLYDFTTEQKAYLKEQLPKFASKQAVLVKNGFSKLFFNTFLYFYKPNIPIKGFSSKKEAFEWLKNEKSH